MREIKFRAKQVDTGEWLYGDLLQPNYERFLKNKDIGNFLDEYKISILEKDFIRNDYVIDPETIGQYTRLKDINGKEIYEGDIVKGTIVSSWAKQKIKCKVIYKKDRFVCTDKDGGVHRVLFGKDISVIGNVYDNPKLLKGE